jgi:hypothetical protein
MAPIVTPLEYYSDEENFGNYQYVTLKEVIDEFMVEAMDDDSLLKNTKRSLFILYAKQGIKKLTEDIPGEVLAIERTIGEQLYFPFPQDYVDWVRISVVDQDGKLQPLNVNKNMNTATGYLQDSNAELLFDNDGYILTSDSNNVIGRPYHKYAFSDYHLGGYFEADTSKLSRYGEAVFDERRGVVAFSSDLVDKEVVLEYKSDGLQWEKLLEQQITVHKLIQEPLRDWIRYCVYRNKRNVSLFEKQIALNRYKTTAHQAKIKRSDIDIIEISRVLNSGSKMF